LVECLNEQHLPGAKVVKEVAKIEGGLEVAPVDGGMCNFEFVSNNT
jgi:hypothetical protein